MSATIELAPEVTAAPVKADRDHRLLDSAVNDCYAYLDSAEAIIDCVLAKQAHPMLSAARKMVSDAREVGSAAIVGGVSREDAAAFLAVLSSAVEVLTAAADAIDDRALWGAAFLAQCGEETLKEIAQDVDEREARAEGGAVAEALQELLSALSTMLFHGDKVSLEDDPRDEGCAAALLLNDAEAAVYSLAMAPSTDHLWQFSSTSARAVLRMVHRSLQQAHEKPAGLGVAQMAMLPAAITLASHLAAVLELADPQEQMAAARNLEKELRTQGFAAIRHSEKEEETPAEALLLELQQLTLNQAEDLPIAEGEALYGAAYLFGVARQHVACSNRSDDPIPIIEDACLAIARAQAILTLINRSLSDRVVSASLRLSALAKKEMSALIDLATSQKVTR